MKISTLRCATSGFALAIALPAAAVMEIDPSYSAEPFGQVATCPAVKLLGDQGTLQATYQTFSRTGATAYNAVRRKADGTLDRSWGNQGVADLGGGSFGTLTVREIFTLPDGGFLFAGQYAVKLFPDGTRDPSYGGMASMGLGGRSEPFGGNPASFALFPDGSLVAMAYATDTFDFTRVDASGRRDMNFGAGGTLSVPRTGVAYAWGVQGDGQVQVATYPQTAGGGMQLHRYPNDFAATEASAGRLVPRDVVALWMDPGAKVTASGRLVLAANGYQGETDKLSVLRFNPDANPDSTFGDGGRRLVEVGAYGQVRGYGVRAMNVAADDSITMVIAHSASIGFFFTDQSLRAARLLANGADDAAFPNNILLGHSEDAVVQRDDGRYVIGKRSPEVSCITEQRVNDRPRSGATLVEYEYRGRYFITAEGLESAILDNDPATQKLRRTGYVLGAWLPAAQPPGSAPLCRFHGDAAGGPAGHFYSLWGAECDLVRADDWRLPQGTRTWRFEGLAFNEVPLPASGACAQNFSPVSRLYNDAARRGGEPNHRFTTDAAVIAQMQAQGWVLEGVAFCAPPAIR